MELKAFFDEVTFTLTYVVRDPATRDAVVIDPVMDYDPAASTTASKSVTAVASYLLEHGLTLRMILETHAHADHLSAATLLKTRFPGSVVAIGASITAVQAVFKRALDLDPDFPVDGSQFDRLLADGDFVHAGSLPFTVLATPGHTQACSSYRFGDLVFTGDALFMPDYGTGRCDFPGGSARDLYRSITERLYRLPDHVLTCTAHDYLPGGRPLRYSCSVGEQKRANIQLDANTTEAAFIRFREARDRTLSAPKLLYPSVQVNIAGGRLPPAAANGSRYLKIPITVPPAL